MLATPDPAPTGLITALLGRARVSASAITAAIGPSPRQMRELTEGRGLFSPYKLKRVAELTRVPEEAIREAVNRASELIEAVGVSEGDRVEHPRLGPCEVVSGGKHLTLRTEKGELIEAVHPISLASPELLDRFGLTPAPEEAENAPSDPAAEPATTAPHPNPETGETLMKSVVEETLAAREEPAKDADVRADPAPDTGDASEAGSDPAPAEHDLDPREVVRELVSRSGRSQAALSRALGKDPAYLNAILKRGRRVPEDLIYRLTPLCLGEEAQATAPEPGPKEVAAPVTPPLETAQASPEASAELVTAKDAPEPRTAATEPQTTSPDPNASDRADLFRLLGAERGADPSPSETMEVVIDGVCRVRVPAGFDMEAAARLIRAVSAAGAAAE